eukprot:UN10335
MFSVINMNCDRTVGNKRKRGRDEPEYPTRRIRQKVLLYRRALRFHDQDLINKPDEINPQEWPLCAVNQCPKFPNWLKFYQSYDAAKNGWNGAVEEVQIEANIKTRSVNYT